MTINPILRIIRAKKLGVLIRDVRGNSGKSLEACAEAMGISNDEMIAMEAGERPPTLPELEILAYFLEVPLEHFWGSATIKSDGGEKLVDPVEIKQIRQAEIGSLIEAERGKAEISIEGLAEKAGVDPTKMQSYEKGEVPIPLPELETIVLALDNSIENFEDQQGPVGNWFTRQRNMHEFLDLPPELKEFISKPVNRPYLEMAVRLSELKTDKLRALAEGILEITL